MLKISVTMFFVQNIVLPISKLENAELLFTILITIKHI